MLISEELLAAEIADRERELGEMSRLRQVRQVREDRARRSRAWTWRVEPGMEQAFRALRDWFLSGLVDG